MISISNEIVRNILFWIQEKRWLLIIALIFEVAFLIEAMCTCVSLASFVRRMANNFVYCCVKMPDAETHLSFFPMTKADRGPSHASCLLRSPVIDTPADTPPTGGCSFLFATAPMRAPRPATGWRGLARMMTSSTDAKANTVFV